MSTHLSSLCFVCAVVVFCSKAQERTIIPPPAPESQFANAFLSYSWGPEQVQVFRNSATWNHPVLITEIAFRQAFATNDGPINETYSRFEIRLSTTTTPPESLASYRGSFGADVKLVFLRTGLILTNEPGTNVFNVRFRLDSPFPYDSGKGHLLMHMVRGSRSTSSIARLIAQESSSDWKVSYGEEMPPQPSKHGMELRAAGLLTEFTWIDKPSLSARLVGDQIVMNWPLHARTFQLFSSGATYGQGWTALTELPASTASEFRVTNSVAGAARFYQLRAP